MAVPKYHELERPLLELLAEDPNRVWRLKELAPVLAARLKLSEADLAETVQRGQSKFEGRIGWAKYELAKANLVETVERGAYRVTGFGLQQLPLLPIEINRAYLVAHRIGDWGGEDNIVSPKVPAPPNTDEDPPDERIDAAFAELQQLLVDEVLGRLKTLTPSDFERFVVELLKAMGYGIGEVTGRSGDGGIDGVIYEDRLRLDRIFLQAKRWSESPVGAPDINGFIGALARQGANRGVFVTTSRYTQEAKNAAAVPHLRIILIDGVELARLAVEYNVGVSLKRKIELKRLDSDYFDEL